MDEINPEAAVRNLRVALGDYMKVMEQSLGKEVLQTPRVRMAIGIIVIDDRMMSQLDRTEYKFFSFGDGDETLSSHEAIGLAELLREYASL